MTTDLAVRERLTPEQLTYISKTEMIPKAYRGNVPAIMACVATGRELGIGDMHALRSIHVVDGKATLSAELMVTLARQAGHSITAEFAPDAVKVTGKRADNGDTMTVEWTMEKAKTAGLAVKPNWKNYPDAMLWARAVSQLCRMLFPDVMMGLAFTRDEFGETTVEIPGDALDHEDVVDGEELAVEDGAIDEALHGDGDTTAEPTL